MTVRWPVVLFDLDGTLANTIDAIVASYTYTWASVGREVSRDEIIPWIGRTLKDVFSEQAPDQAEELEARYIEHNMAHLAELVTGYEGIPELLVRLDQRGIKTGIVTAKRRYNAEITMKLANIPSTTPLLCAMEDCPSHKPHPAPLLKGLATISPDTPPEQAVYIGDAIFDLQAAHRASMSGIGVLWGAGRYEDLHAQVHEQIVSSIDELSDVLIG